MVTYCFGGYYVYSNYNLNITTKAVYLSAIIYSNMG